MTDTGSAALLVIDVQPDFMPGGALPVPEGDRIVEPINALIRSKAFELYVATQDWHPPGHVSFARSHPGRAPFETIQLYGHEQRLWPDHCLQGSAGAELHPELLKNAFSAIIRKGADAETDSYSGFRNNWNPHGERPPTGLTGYLREQGVREVYVCGLARDVCCKWTAEDAAGAGFQVRFLWDLTRPVDPAADGAVREALLQRGVSVLEGEQLAHLHVGPRV